MKITKGILAVPFAISIAVAAPALAAPPYDVIVGGNGSERDVEFTGVAEPIDFIGHGLIDVDMSCDKSTATGDVHAGPGNAGHVATIDNSIWEGCVGPLQLDMEVQHQGEWELWADDTSVTGPPPADTAVSGYIDNIEADVWATDEPDDCAFTVTGAADATFNEVTQELNVAEDGTVADNHELTINVDGGGSTCGGLLSDGDPASFFGDFDVTNADGAIDITDGA